MISLTETKLNVAGSGGARAGLSLRRAGHRRVCGQDLEEVIHCVSLR
jgi:hypothetical protein